MEKSLKLINNNFSLSEFNFSGFSSSVNWVGFFERKHDFSYHLIDESIELFSDFFEGKHASPTIITALSFDDDKEDDIETIARYQEIYHSVKEKNLLLPMTESYENYLYGETLLPAHSLSFSFTKNDFIDLSKLIMCHAGVIGQVCFYINPALNIGVYPHEDTGFGCIALNGEKNTCIDFLTYCKKNENFNVVIDN
ncbi:hypothetical protein XBJ2_2880002 [Xenorhabdus bovienii str. Jollieti]|uniref:Uncharacterized protein n=1 Tax=Xenorhabdus bovienii (strain SS-2004) TaxID=406818 RepID=D3UYR6_XENBS|nr:hypothetical protein [Xenorhabdus bovienii]CBJ79444.1 hypothetical protein XBJ1_0293 [Xenorhabdus bovienii SS-2004]CDH29533.1 hypothetical protein XBJ2_2880002 [Xenorhabdus bovienii str. Jollieti]